jgi:hypothetical protein
LPLAPGQKLSRYTITAAIGAGGMGEVYRATDEALDREIALKLLPSAFAADPERLARFEREAKLLASLNHPGIAHLYGFEIATLADGGNAHVLVMELVPGEDLAERLKRGPLPIDEALEVARQLSAALEEAHEKGIVHRDLKPANVKLTPDGKVKVLDFGLAKAWTGDVSGAASSAPDLSQSPTLARTGTAAGLILGTAAYMSPEQARGRPVDRRTDIWSFGAVLYEMLTGRPLFSGETVSDVLAGVLAREIDWAPLPEQTPATVRRLLERCLERDPRERLRDIGDARHELGRGGARQPRAAAAGSAPRSAFAASGAARRGSALAAATVTFALRSRRETPAAAAPMVFALPAPPDTRLKAAVISPDGRSIVFAAEAASGESHLWLRRLDSRDARKLEGTAGALEPFWSPDSRFVGFFTQAQLFRVEAATGTVEPLAAATDTRGGAWNQQGTVLMGGNKLQRLSPNGGAVSTALELDGANGENAIRYPSFLPDGDHVLFYSRNAKDRARAGLWVVSLASGERKQLAAAAGSSAVYIEPGYLLYRRDRYLLAHPFDPRRLEFKGEPKQVAEDVWYDPGVTAQANVSVSRGGVLTFRTGGVELSDLAWLDRQGRLVGTEWEAKSFTTFVLSRDGRQLLANFPGQGVERQAWLFDRQAAAAQQVTSSGDAITLLFSDDGKSAVVGMHASGVSGLWRTRLGSGALPEPLPATTADGTLPFAMDWRGAHRGLLGVREARRALRAHALREEPRDGRRRPPAGRRPGQPAVRNDLAGRKPARVFLGRLGEWEVYVASLASAGERWRVSTAGGTSRAGVPTARSSSTSPPTGV